MIGLSIALAFGVAFCLASLSNANDANTTTSSPDSQFTGSICQPPPINCLPPVVVE